jgi:hypothetical protein
VRLWLRWLRRAVPSAAERAQPQVRPQVATVFSLLSQVFGVLGRFRHAATAAQVALFHHGPERAGAAQASARAGARGGRGGALRDALPACLFARF